MSKPQVVIVRKDKKLHKAAHLIAFAATGGASSVITATQAARIAAYNARTRELQAETEGEDLPPRKGNMWRLRKRQEDD